MRDKFAMPEGTYLLSHSVGCLPADSQEVMAERYYRPWAEKGGDAWPLWLEEVARFRAAVARLLGGRPDQVCPQANVSGAAAKILHALPERPGRKALLLCEEDFPSLGFVLGQAKGYELRFLPRGAAAQDPAAWERALGEDVQLALVTHAFSNRSALLPVAEITRLARRAGVFTIVDAVQSAGVIPIDVGRWRADFVIGSCVKFLCGGPGAGFLWAADEALAEMRPIDVGWFSHADPFAFDIHDFRPAEDAARFWGGTPSVAPYVQAAHSIETLLGIGVEAIHAHNQRLIDRLHDAFGDRIASERTREGDANAVLIRTPDPAAAVAMLNAAGVRCDAREGCVRVSPHIYNDDADIERLIGVL